MIGHTPRLSLIGFGEAGRTFAAAGDWGDAARVFDIKTLAASPLADAMRAAYADNGVIGCESSDEAMADSAIAISLVTADQASPAAREAARAIRPGALFFDMNSVSPGRKQASARAIEAAGGRYVDVAVMAPVNPARLAVPLLVAGPHAQDAAATLRAIGFAKVTISGETVGAASATKMVRSVMIKGIEALTAEMMLAADAAGVADAVLASLGGDWDQKADYNLDRMLLHGARRAAEMEEVAATLTELGIEPLMTTGTIARQRTLGGLLAGAEMPGGLAAKLDFLAARQHGADSGPMTRSSAKSQLDAETSSA